MTEVDMQNIVVHELGHNLGLSHCNYSSDVMYPIVYYRDTVKPLSSLDIYAVSQRFEWIPNSSQSSSSITCPKECGDYAIKHQLRSLPDSCSKSSSFSASNLTEYAIELFMRPETLTALLVAMTLIVAKAILIKRRKKPQ